MSRLAVLGLDAMSWRYFDKLFRYGVMPYTKALVRKSYRAPLEALPPVTPPSWTSIMTGVNPGKHGIFGFFKYERGSWKQSLFTALDLRHPRVHEMLSFLGSKSIVFNPIPDYPVIPVKNAEVVSNLFLTPKPASWPEEALKRYFGDEDPHSYLKDVTCGILEGYQKVIELYEGAIELALRRDAELLWANLNVPDLLFHRCPEMLDPSTLLEGERALFGRLDRIVKKLDESHDSLIIVSDHGFSFYERMVSVNDILVRNGLAKAGPKRKVEELSDYRLRRKMAEVENLERLTVPSWLYRFVKVLGLSGPARALLSAYSRLKGRKVTVSTSTYVDVESSYAFLPDAYSFGVYVKRKEDRAPVLRALKMYRDALDVYPAEEFYSGSYVGSGPDIVTFPKFYEGFWIAGNALTGLPQLKVRRYAHHPLGVLIVRSDRGIRPAEGGKIPNYSVASIALGLMRKPLPKLRDIPKWLEKELLGEVEELGYEVRWEIVRRIRSRKGRRAPQVD